MMIRPLTKELQAKAIAELNENPTRIQEDIQYIKEWLLQQKYIKARTGKNNFQIFINIYIIFVDDQWLLSFLRGCKFSLERTKEKLDMYYTMRGLVPEFFKNRDPFSPQVQEVLKCGLV